MKSWRKLWPNFKTHPDKDRVRHKVWAKFLTLLAFWFVFGLAETTLLGKPNIREPDYLYH